MPLTSSRNTKARSGDTFVLGLAAAVKVFAGGILCRNAAGKAVPGSTSTTLKALGRTAESVDNSNGLADEQIATYEKGVFYFKNSAAADEITTADLENDCFIVDDETVAKTNGGTTRSIAGRIKAVDANGVAVKFD